MGNDKQRASEESLRAFRERFPPSCPLGYTDADLERHFGATLGEAHPLWAQLRGQTGSICEGRRFNHEIGEYESDECARHPHGYISYVWDVQEWYEGKPVSDW